MFLMFFTFIVLDTDEFLKAVQDNPALEGWGNKIVQITKGDFISDGE